MIENPNLDNLDINHLLVDKMSFKSFVYTPVKKAIEDLNHRILLRKTTVFCSQKRMIPIPFQGEDLKAVLFRQLITPNYEFRRFIEVVKSNKLRPIFLEFHEDRFSTKNPLKHSLGKMRFEQVSFEKGKRSRLKTIIEFNKSDGKKISDVLLKNNKSLIEFHHKILEQNFPSFSKFLFDGSKWFKSQGNATKYYLEYISLFVNDAILFENFLLEGEELHFIKNVFLPAFISIWKSTGMKPLICPLLPFETESDQHWLSHPYETLVCINEEKMIQ